NFLNGDLCVVGGQDYFVRCVLEVQIQDADSMLGWGVWVSQSKSNFELYADTFDATPERVTFGYFANRLPAYPDTVNMRTQVHWQTGRKRPIIELEPSDHPLYRDWIEGIPRERAIEFVQKELHPDT
ncbi:MAG TPA: DUF2199 domain-containing protein, partial [Sphingomicrobium sp.]|nr:DUF2199 domain-containing protein [Sphingomicrobium sp.]